MAAIGKNANIDVLLGNERRVVNPLELLDIAVQLDFIGEAQANLAIEEVTFVAEDYVFVKQKFLESPFEGIEFRIDVFNVDTRVTVFDGLVRFDDDNVFNDDKGYVKGQIEPFQNITTFNKQLEALDYAFLVDRGIITKSDYVDVPYVVEKIDNTLESFVQAITFYLLVKELQEAIRVVADSIAEVAALTANPITAANGLALAIANTALNLVYATAILIQVVNLGIDLINTFAKPKRIHKAATLFTLISKVCQYLGYNFNTSITDLEKFVYLASNTNVDEYNDKALIKKVGTIKQGIPSVLDYGSKCSEMFQLVKNLFNGRFAVIDNTVEFHTELSPFWEINTDYVLPDLLDEDYTYNLSDCKASTILQFNYDIQDGYTIDNFKGTNYQVLAEVKQKRGLNLGGIRGKNEVSLSVALGNRKDKLSPIEKLLSALAQTFDTVINTVARTFLINERSNLSSKLTKKLGVLKVEKNNHSVPKLLYLNTDGTMPKNHRDKLSAKSLYNKGLIETSFLYQNGKAQRIIFNKEIPFGLVDFGKITRNAYFTTKDGKKGKFISLKWNILQDKASALFYIEEKYTNNIIETFIEAE